MLAAGVALLALSLGDRLASPRSSRAPPSAGSAKASSISAGLAAIAERAPAERRGETASSFFVVLYFGLSIPVIAAGIAIHYTSLRSAGIGFCAGVALLALGVLGSELRSSVG